MNPEHVLQNLDWRLLDQQRLRLGDMVCTHHIDANPEEREAIEGILAFLDALTDAAHATGRLTRP